MSHGRKEKALWGNPHGAARSGGELGIRTPDTLGGYTRLAGEHLRPLGQLSGKGARASYLTGAQLQSDKLANLARLHIDR